MDLWGQDRKEVVIASRLYGILVSVAFNLANFHVSNKSVPFAILNTWGTISLNCCDHSPYIIESSAIFGCFIIWC